VRLAGAAAAILVLGVALGGCGNDKPSVCGSVDALETSINNVGNIDPASPNAVDELKLAISNIESDMEQVKSDAKTQFSSQIDAVNSSLATLKTRVTAAKADPTAVNVAAAGAALGPFTSDAKTLISDVKSTC